MGDNKTEMLEATKLLLGINNNENDNRILLLIDEVTDATLFRCRLDVMPRQIEGFIPTLTARRFIVAQSNGVKSVTEEFYTKHCQIKKD
ncbi:MAG: phage head-tail connector protein [Oscillospiraceae bacterium]|nr:phage head-tail connector protein [Oscillospiraceae bacterium]